MKHFCLMEELALEISAATSEDGLFEALARASMRLGFDHFALAYDRRGNAEPASLLVHNYPDAWAKVYVGFDLGGADPVRRAGERSMTGFRWDEIESYIPLTRGDRQMLHVGREYGLADGYTVPRHLPGEASGACSFVLRPQSELQDDMLRIAEIIGALAIVSARQLVGAVPLKNRATLSERQRECVLWTARGKTAAEVAVILGIGEVTVVQHLKTARDRYDVHCGQMLTLCALFDGLIGFGDVYDWWHAR